MLKAGDKVRFIGAKSHEFLPEFFPPVGTVGEIIGFDEDEDLLVQWEKGSTSENDLWSCNKKIVERIENNGL